MFHLTRSGIWMWRTRAQVFVVDATESSSSVMVAATLKKQITAAAQTADPNNAYKSARFARAVRFHSDHMAALARSASCSSRDSNMLGLFKGAAAKVHQELRPIAVLAFVSY